MMSIFLRLDSLAIWHQLLKYVCMVCKFSGHTPICQVNQVVYY